MPPGPNGAATKQAVADTTDDDALNLGDLLPETRTVTIIRDGKQERLEAFMYRTAPLSIYSLIAIAHDHYMTVVRDDAAASVHRDQAVCEYYKSIARALVPGLTVDEADRLGGDFPRLERMLGALGYPPPRAETPEGEVAGGQAEQTMDASSPESSPSMVSPTAMS
jgi:hypothetical protein